MDDKDLLIKFGRNLKAERNRKGLTQDAFAEILNVNREHISKLECGKVNISLKKINNLAKALSVNITQLLQF